MDTISPAGHENATASGHTTDRKTAHKERVEVITRGERRRSWTVEQKREIARESLAPGASVAAVARKHEIPRGLLYTWRKRLQRGELGGEPRFLRVVTSNEGGEPREAPPATGLPGGACRKTRLVRQG